MKFKIGDSLIINSNTSFTEHQRDGEFVVVGQKSVPHIVYCDGQQKEIKTNLYSRDHFFWYPEETLSKM